MIGKQCIRAGRCAGLAASCVLGLAPGICWSALAPAGPRTEAVDRNRYQEVRYVSGETGSDAAGDGSRPHPWQSIQHALTQATAAGAGHRVAILVAQGRYGEATICLREHVHLFGGFEPVGWTRDIWRHPARLDGRHDHRVLAGANHARVDGFVIAAGSVAGGGGGLLCDGASPTVTNNLFVGNRTVGPDPWHPRYLHQRANDGGAVYCTNGAAPIIAHNTFADNATRIGRGGAVALDGRCCGRIAGNVFFRNKAGLNDPKRSSDGGAISVFNWSSPVIEHNILLGNRALSANDGGAIFVALWSSPVIAGNTFVDNACEDDGCALFVGGQEHRYDRPADPLPVAAKFLVEISANVFVGNVNRRLMADRLHSSVAVRCTMETRGRIVNNILAQNAGFCLERSETVLVNNTILEDVVLVETKPELKPSLVTNNIIWGDFDMRTNAAVAYSNIRDGFAGTGNISAEPRFVDDQLQLSTHASTYNPAQFVSQIQVAAGDFAGGALAGRVVRAGDRWGVVKAGSGRQLTVWGDVSGAPSLALLPTYSIRSNSPGVDKGTLTNAPQRDINGDKRPLGNGIDMGADEYAGAKDGGR